MVRRVILFLFSLGLIFSAAAQQISTVRYSISLEFTDQKQSYYIDLLTLALDNTIQEYGPYKLEAVVIEMPQGRTSIMVEKENVIDVTWRMTSKELEQKLAAVYWPLLKGLMGYRIFIIDKQKHALFEQIVNEQQLKNLVAGQGIDWPDAKILAHNGYQVMKSPAMTLLNMLEKGRLDYFPRALHEPWIEIAQRSQFEVESQLMLRYPAPMFFFVNKANYLLHERLTLGLEKAYLNGSFERLFSEHPVTKEILAKANIDERLVFDLTNPLLSEQAQLAMDKIKPYMTSQ